MSAQPRTASGRCRCGAIGWHTVGAPLAVSYCHCADCRQATGAPLTVFVGYAGDQVRFETETPAVHAVRPGVDRLFCRDCGTPIGYRDAALGDALYFYLGVMQSPERFVPECHAFVDEALPWLVIDDCLPRYRWYSQPR